MNCERVKELFSELHEGSLDAGLRLKAEEHLQGCASCQHEFEGFKSLYAGLVQMPAGEPPMDFSERIARGLDKIDWDRKQTAPRFGWLKLAAAGACVALLGVAYFNRPSSGIQMNPVGLPDSVARPLAARIVDGVVHLQLRSERDVVISVYQGGRDFVTLPPLDAALLRSDKVAAMARYNVPLEGASADVIWVMSSDATEPIHAIFIGGRNHGQTEVHGNLVAILQGIATRYGATMDAQIKEAGPVRDFSMTPDTTLEAALTQALEGTGLSFAASDGIVSIK